MLEQYEKVIAQLDSQFERVFDMMEFDKDFIKIVIDQLKQQGELLRINHGIQNEKLLPYGSISLLESICSSGPKRRKYQPIYNQSLVLMVSYFSSAVSSIFNDTLTYYLNHIDDIPKGLAREEFKFSVSELKELEYDLSTEIGRIVARKGDVSFQDMQSIYRAFKRYFDVEIVKDEVVDTIIAAQSLRHAIVHNAEVIDEKCQRQLGVADSRGIMLEFKLGDEVVVNMCDLDVVSKSMTKYIRKVSNLLLERIKHKTA